MQQFGPYPGFQGLPPAVGFNHYPGAYLNPSQTTQLGGDCKKDSQRRQEVDEKSAPVENQKDREEGNSVEKEAGAQNKSII